jgi:hypothetical protein
VTGGDVRELGAERRHRPVAGEAGVNTLDDGGLERRAFGHGHDRSRTVSDALRHRASTTFVFM